MNIEYKISEPKPRIFFLKFKNHYTCSMMLLRYQEYYESHNPEFRGNNFRLVEFMDWYVSWSKEEVFTYPTDWVGFNFPSSVIEELIQKGIPDFNAYDLEMEKIYQNCLKQYPDGKFYIVASSGGKVTLRHEMAHGLFYLDEDYRKEMTNLVQELKPSFKKKMFEWFAEIGYTSEVYVDECQAYLATGTPKFLKAKDKDKAFRKVFNTFFKK